MISSVVPMADSRNTGDNDAAISGESVEYIVPVAIGMLPVLGLFSAMTGRIARCRVKSTVQKALF
jgi:hypothetical protein